MKILVAMATKKGTILIAMATIFIAFLEDTKK